VIALRVYVSLRLHGDTHLNTVRFVFMYDLFNYTVISPDC